MVAPAPTQPVFKQPGIGLVVLNLVSQHLSVSHGVQGQEGLGEARGKGCLGLSDTIFGTSHLGGVAGDEVEHSLGCVELGDGWQDTASVAGEKDDIGGVVGRHARNLGVVNVLDRVGAVECSSVRSRRRSRQGGSRGRRQRSQGWSQT